MRASAAAQVLASACLIVASLLLPEAAAQRRQSSDPISIVGTWSSGSGNVVTGLNFFNPINETFNIPKTGGQSYSFTSDGHWEQALFLFQADPASPNCAQAQLVWQHGNYTQHTNGSLTLTPYAGDGRQMLQNGCSQVSSSVSYYNQEEFMRGFYIRLDWHHNAGGYYLQMFGFDGTPKPWLWQVYNPPQMLPTTPLKQEVYGSLNG